MTAAAEVIDDYCTAVDRRIFIDLLHKVSRFQPVEDHVYVSQPGPSMEDHKLVHRELGLEKLLAIDEDPEVVKRQRFNRPTEACRCINKSTADLADDPTTVLEEEGFGDPPAPVIVWLRRVHQADAGAQLREVEDLIGKLREFSIVRITFNADLREWAGEEPDPRVRRALPTLRSAALRELQRQIGDYLEPSLTDADLSDDGMAATLAGAFGVAAGRAIGAASGLVLTPLSVIRFEGQQRLVSLTGIIVKQSSLAKLRRKITRGNWPFISTSWTQVQKIILPNLTVRERLTLEFLAGESKAAASAKLNFDIDIATGQSGLFANFSQFHRYYPVRLSAEL